MLICYCEVRYIRIYPRHYDKKFLNKKQSVFEVTFLNDFLRKIEGASPSLKDCLYQSAFD